MVLVSGPAGVGKSRLGWEFEKYVDGLADARVVAPWPLPVATATGSSTGRWRRSSDSGSRSPRTTRPHVAADKLRQGLVEHVTDPNDRDFIGSAFGRLLGAETDTRTRSARSVATTCSPDGDDCSNNSPRPQPVVILIEDAHHAAGELLDFLDHLVDWARDLPIFVLVFARPDIDDRRPGFGSGATVSPSPSIRSTPPRWTQLVDALFPDTTPNDRSLIVGHGRGHPALRDGDASGH